MDHDREIVEFLFTRNKVQKAPARRISRLLMVFWSQHCSRKGARRAEEKERKKERKKERRKQR